MPHGYGTLCYTAVFKKWIQKVEPINTEQRTSQTKQKKLWYVLKLFENINLPTEATWLQAESKMHDFNCWK